MFDYLINYPKHVRPSLVALNFYSYTKKNLLHSVKVTLICEKKLFFRRRILLFLYCISKVESVGFTRFFILFWRNTYVRTRYDRSINLRTRSNINNDNESVKVWEDSLLLRAVVLVRMLLYFLLFLLFHHSVMMCV